MSQCPNCGAAMSCGCQKKVLPNGKIGCAKCYKAAPTAVPHTDEKIDNTSL
jgi:hypothetical protein